ELSNDDSNDTRDITYTSALYLVLNINTEIKHQLWRPQPDCISLSSSLCVFCCSLSLSLSSSLCVFCCSLSLSLSSSLCVLLLSLSLSVFCCSLSISLSLSDYEPLAPPLPPAATAVPVWQDRTIASSKLRMLEYSAFMEVQRDPDNYSKHLFVHIGQTNPSYSDPLLEAVDIRQIYDKFPEKKGGLKELYEKGPQNAFFLVKFWVGDKSLLLLCNPHIFTGQCMDFKHG
ncbi:unnamed protein product, partial [Oncorhynchus mykiss]